MTEFHIYRDGSDDRYPYTIMSGAEWGEGGGRVEQVTQTLWGARLWIKLHGKKVARRPRGVEHIESRRA